MTEITLLERNTQIYCVQKLQNITLQKLAFLLFMEYGNRLKNFTTKLPSTTRQLSGAQIFRGILSQKVTGSGSSPGAGTTSVVLQAVSKKVSQTIFGSI